MHIEKTATVALGGGTLLLISILPVVLSIQASAHRELTSLENTLFASTTFVFSMAGSAIISAYYGGLQARKEYVQLARPALRRVVVLSSSANDIISIVQEKQAISSTSAPDGTLVSAWLDAIERLLRQHSRQLEAAITDWQELLPDDYAELIGMAQMQAEINERIEAIRELSASRNADAGNRITLLTTEVSRLQRELERERAESGLGIPQHLLHGHDDDGRPTHAIFAGRTFATEEGTFDLDKVD